MSEQQKDQRARPVFVVKKGTMSPKDIRRLERMAFLCVVESTEPDEVRFLDPPADADVPAQARAALVLFRIVKNSSETHITRSWFVTSFVNILMDPPIPQVKKVRTR